MSAEDSDAARHENGAHDDFGLAKARTRVSRACTRCRSRKDKCDGRQPSCSACISVSQPCSYEPSTKKRGLPEGYVRGLEKLWAVLVAKIDGIEDAVAHVLDEHRDTLLQVWNHRQTGEELHSMWKDSRVLQELETLLAALDTTAAQGTKRKRDRDEDEVGLHDGDLNLHKVLSVSFQVQSTSSMPPPASDYAPTAQYVAPSAHSEMVILPATTSELIGQYFKFTHCWLPMLDRGHIMRRCYEFTKAHTEVGQSNVDLAVLAAALAHASRYSPNLGRSLNSDVQMDSTSLSRLSRKCIPSADNKFELGHVQALLILVLCDIGNGNWDSAWRSVGLAVRALQGMEGEESLSSKTLAATRQAAVILDTLLAIKHGRRPQLCGQDVPANNLLPPDDHEEWEPWTAPDSVNFYTSEPAFTISSFNHLTKIFVILNDFVQGRPGTQRVAPQEKLNETLQALDTLANGYISPLGDSVPRPPHQLWLKATHRLAVAYVAAPEPDKTLSVLQCLDSVSDILQTWTNASSIGLTTMPTFLFGLLHATCESLSPGYEASASLSLSTNPFGLGLLADRLNEASASWPEAGHLARRLREQFGPGAGGAFDHPQDRPGKRRRDPSYPLGSAQTQHGILNLWPADPFTQTFATASQNLHRSSSVRNERVNSASVGQVFPTLQGSFQNPAMNNSDVGANVLQQSSGVAPSGNVNLENPIVDHGIGSISYNPSIATSPSFHGDEIDALFHEMAQLDTAEWTTGRRQGLKDLGFDDMTFEAFCNDPDRLYSSNAFDGLQMGSLPQVNTFGFDPNLANPPTGTTFNALDMMDSSWNG